MPHGLPHRWKPGDPLKAEWLDQTAEIAQRLDRIHAAGFSNSNSSFSSSADRQYSTVYMVKMDEVLGLQSSSGFRNRTATIQILNTRTGGWEHYGGELDIVTSAFYDAPYDNEEMVACYMHQGKLVPLNYLQIRHAQTVRQRPELEYPTEDSCPNVYPFRFVRLSYLEEQGQQGVTAEYLGQGDTELPFDDFVFNLYTGEENYLPEFTIIWVYYLNGQWFTYARGDDEDCEQRSDNSSSSSSESSASQNSSGSSSSQSQDSASSGSSSASESSHSQESDSSMLASDDCQTEIPRDIDDIDGYDASRLQVLANNHGCLQWLNVETCS